MATEVMKVLMIILIGVGPVKTDELLRLILVCSNYSIFNLEFTILVA